ncbi:hypothetical protein YC2023_108933 [Brassica napus]
MHPLDITPSFGRTLLFHRGGVAADILGSQENQTRCDGMEGYLTPCSKETDMPIFRSPMEVCLAFLLLLPSAALPFHLPPLTFSIFILIEFAISGNHATT